MIWRASGGSVLQLGSCFQQTLNRSLPRAALRSRMRAHARVHAAFAARARCAHAAVHEPAAPPRPAPPRPTLLRPAPPRPCRAAPCAAAARRRPTSGGGGGGSRRQGRGGRRTAVGAGRRSCRPAVAGAARVAAAEERAALAACPAAHAANGHAGGGSVDARRLAPPPNVRRVWSFPHRAQDPDNSASSRVRRCGGAGKPGAGRRRGEAWWARSTRSAAQRSADSARRRRPCRTAPSPPWGQPRGPALLSVLLALALSPDPAVGGPPRSQPADPAHPCTAPPAPQRRQWTPVQQQVGRRLGAGPAAS